MSPNPTDPERYVKENQEILTEVIEHSSNKFIRALAIAALIEYGDDPSAEQLLDEVESIRENDGSKLIDHTPAHNESGCRQCGGCYGNISEVV